MARGDIFDLSGKVALITAGGSGLGRAYCEAMAEFGADVACNDISEQTASETAENIKRFGHKVMTIKANASKQDEIERMVNMVIEKLGKLDIVFCNAGITVPRHRLHEIPIEDWDRLMALNLRGTYLLMRAALGYMVKQRKGIIIVTASIGGLYTGKEGSNFTGLSAYNTSKSAVIRLTKQAASEYGKDGIRVNAIAPGYHRTNILSQMPPEKRAEQEEIMARHTPLGRVGSPDEIKGLAVWLASDASSYVTGQVIVEDGGFVV